jgi:hypothetical protein
MLLALHLMYSDQFAVGKQSLDCLEGNLADAKTKFEKNQKDHEAELSLKHQREEKEQQEAAKNCKLVVESSVKLTAMLDKFSDAFVKKCNVVGIDVMLSSFKDQLLQCIDARAQAAEARIASKLDKKFGDLFM